MLRDDGRSLAQLSVEVRSHGQIAGMGGTEPAAAASHHWCINIYTYKREGQRFRRVEHATQLSGSEPRLGDIHVLYDSVRSVLWGAVGERVG